MDLIYSVDTFEDGNKAKLINSPRSLEACLRLGLDPIDLMPKPLTHFKDKNFTDEMIEMKYKYFEQKRKDRIESVKQERQAIIKFANTRNGSLRTLSPLKHNNTALMLTEASQMDRATRMLEAENKRLETLKRRQEQELARIIEKEQVLVDLQIKIQRGEKEDLKRKKEHDKKVQEQHIEEEKKQIQRLQELKKFDEEETKRRREIQRKETIFERKMRSIRKAEEKRILKEARERDLERERVIVENQKRTDQMIQLQLEKAEESRRIMLEREERVQNQLKQKKESKSIELREKQEKAARRIQEAMRAHHKIQAEKKATYDKRVSEAVERSKEKAVIERDLLKKRIEEKEKLERDRIRRLVESYKARSERRKNIIKRAEDRAHGYDHVKKEMDDRIAKLKFSLSLRMDEKYENVERIARVNEFRRLQTLKRVEQDDLTYERLMTEKEEMLRRHREELKQALIRKHQITDAMEQMRVTNDFSLLSKLDVMRNSTRVNRESNNDEEIARATSA